MSEPIKLHLGCGPVVKPGFLNYDYNPVVPGVIQCDLRSPLPHPDNTVDFIFSEHFIEHITRDEALALLKECFRVLKPGGAIRVTTPDLRFLVDAYVKEDITRWIGGWAPKTPCRMMNEGLSSWGHQFTYDMPELMLILSEAGFSSITPRKHGEHEARGWSGEIVAGAVKS